MMCSYNQIDSIWACENDYTMNTVLKGELGFKGYVMSDWYVAKVPIFYIYFNGTTNKKIIYLSLGALLTQLFQLSMPDLT